MAVVERCLNISETPNKKQQKGIKILAFLLRHTK